MPLDVLVTMTLGDYLEQRHAGVDGLVLIFDQFEELLTTDSTDVEEKAAFLDQVGAALRDRGRWALFSIREDWIAGLDPFTRAIPTRFANTYRLDLLGEAAARAAITQPAADAGVHFSEAAATKLVNDLRRVRVQRQDVASEELGPSVEPVQLQVVCSRLWDGLPEGTTEIDEADVEHAGDVDAALAGYYADRVAAAASQTGVSERAIRDWIETALMTEQGFRDQALHGPEVARRRSGAFGRSAARPRRRPPPAIGDRARRGLVRARPRPSHRTDPRRQRHLARRAPHSVPARRRRCGTATSKTTTSC